MGDRDVPHNQLLFNQTLCRQMVLCGPVSLINSHAQSHINTHTCTCTQAYTFALQLEKRGALGYLQSPWCLNTLSVASSGDWQRLNEYFLSLNSIINSLAVPGQEKMFKFTLGESYSNGEFFPSSCLKTSTGSVLIEILLSVSPFIFLLLVSLSCSTWLNFCEEN